MIAPIGTVDAGDAGIRASGNINIAALQILNVGNIQAGSNITGLPIVQAPSVAALTAASATAAAASKSDGPATPTNADRPSIIIVEVLGYGGEENETAPAPRKDDRESYNLNSPVQVVGTGHLNSLGRRILSEQERKQLAP